MNLMKKKGLALLIAFSMMLGAAACGNAEQPAETENGSSVAESTAVEQIGESGQEESGARPKVSVLTIDFSGNALAGENADIVQEELEEFTGIDVEWTFGLSDAYDDKLTLMLASGDDTPMIITVQAMNTQIINYADAGAFWDLSQFINEEDYPHLAQANPEINEYLTINDQLIGIYRGRAFGRYALGYRQDWAEKLGYTSEPQTVDEVYQMMYDFTYGDPDGNGQDDTYGLELCSYTGSLDVMQTWFGVGNEWYEDENGQLLPVHMNDEYMEALNWFKKCYDEGLWASDWATRETSTWSNDCKNSLAGMYCDTAGNSRRIWEYLIDNNISSVANPEETATFNICRSIGKTADDRHNLATSGYGGFFVITKSGAKTEEDVKNCLQLLDRMCSDEMMMLTTYGVEGLHWERSEDGYYVDIRQDVDKEGQDFAGINQLLPQIPSTSISEDFIKFEQSVPQQKENEVVADNTEYAVVNPALSLLIESETYTLNGANLDMIIDDARTNYIIGAIDEEGLKAQWELWAESGGTQVIEEVNAARG